MNKHGLIRRIERAEQTVKVKTKFAPACICFPEGEDPMFHWEIEVELAANVKCPLHGNRFTPKFLVYVSKWLREKREHLMATRKSEQCRKAWYASFPPELWPATEESGDGRTWLRLKDGTRLLAEEYPCSDMRG